MQQGVIQLSIYLSAACKAVFIDTGTVRVNFDYLPIMTMSNWFPIGVSGRRPYMSIATSLRDPQQIIS